MIRHLTGGLSRYRSDLISWISGVLVPLANMPAGTIVGRTTATAYITNTNLTTVLPSDDTTPLVTEGTQTNSVAYALQNANNKLVMRWTGFGSCDNAGGGSICAALFSSTATTAIAAAQFDASSANNTGPILIQHEHAPAATTSITYSVRFGPGSGGAGNARLNGTAAARRFGGVAEATLVIEEIKT